MRPVRLEMNGFASFRTATTVDFEGADYFALIGPTGAGKSTVIDAMVFALYGTAPRWDHATSVKYALAPTVNRGTVRFVFDVGGERYQVAREVRRVGGKPLQKSATLERFDDPTSATADSDHVQPLVTEVSGVRQAVTALLGLTFEDFTKAVVLPQGRFAEFLNATSGERQDILLKLLGAFHYDAIGRAAGARRSQAAAELATADARIGDLSDATPEAAEQAAERLADLQALGTLTEGLLRDLDAARDRSRSAAAALTAAERTVARLDAVAIPDGVADLAERSAAARAEAERLSAAAAEAEHAFTAARGALEAAGNRSLLERRREQWTEHAELEAALPALAEATVRVRDEEASAREALASAEATHAETVAARFTAERTDADAEAALTDLLSRRSTVAALTPPDGLDDLAARLDAAAAQVEGATRAHAEAEAADELARSALRAAGDRDALAADERRYGEALELAATVAGLERDHETARTALDQAREAAETAEADLERARVRADAALEVATAAGLRGHLRVGDACPVCTATVATLPSPLDAAEADAARSALRDAEAAARSARDAATRAESEVNGHARAVTQARERLATLLPDGGDPAALREAAATALARANEARAAADRADAERLARRDALAGATRAAGALDSERHAALAGLRSARAGVAPLGAPDTDALPLPEAWRHLAGWAAAEVARLDDSALPEARSARDAAGDTLAGAGAALDRAAAARQRAADAVRVAGAASVRAEDTLARDRARRDELTGALDGAPDAEQTSQGLDLLTGLEERERVTLAARAEAGRARDAALAGQDALGREVAEAGALLRETREPLIPLGAPAVDPSDLPAAWAALAAWARDTRADASEALQRARDAVAASDEDLAAADLALVDAARARGVEVAASGEVASAVAAQQALAHDLHRRIVGDLDKLVTLRAARADTEARRQVAALLHQHMDAKKFKSWLAGAALDVLVESASSSLLELSGGQFTLGHDNGEFHVVDHTDAEARRSVRTLSGGETFQASLALALALSTELGSMSSTAGRLESIFLDEGFGSLDPDSLEVVALTLERLAQGDRMVGIVTHVQGLAERIPTRFNVSRSSRSSTVVREG